jgi:hypothetical protein
MRFTSSPDVEYWGYKFTVRALSVHVNDADALRGRNMELGAWLLDALLTRAPVAVRESYLVDLAHALLWFVNRGPLESKPRAVALLTRTLLAFLQQPVRSRSLQWSQLRALADPVQRVLSQATETHNPSAADLSGSSVVSMSQVQSSPLMRSVIELVATADSLRKSVVAPSAKVPSKDASADKIAESGKQDGALSASADVVDLRALYQHRLRIVHASIGSVQLSRYFQGMRRRRLE